MRCESVDLQKQITTTMRKFHSVEQSAMHDIYKEQSGEAKKVIEQAKKERDRFKGGWWKMGLRPNWDSLYGYRTSKHYIEAYWYHSISDYINDNFIGVESLATKESRKLNRKLNLHKINKEKN